MLSNANRGEACPKRPEYDALRQLVTQNPQDAQAHFELGFLALKLNDPGFATQCFFNVTQLAPEVEAGFFNLGNAHFAQGNYQQAIEAYGSAFELEPAWGTLNNIGNAHAAFGNSQQAIHVFQQALGHVDQKSPESGCIQGNLGMAYAQVGKWQAAAECFREAFETSAPKAKILNNYLKGCLWSNDYAAGIAATQSPELNDLLDQESFILTAQLHQRTHCYSRAMACLLEALQRSPEDLTALSQIAVLNFARGRRTESLFCFERVRDQVSNSIQLRSHWLRLLNHRPEVSLSEVLSESMAMTNQLLKPVASAAPSAIKQSNIGSGPFRPLRIGFFFNDFQAELDACDFWLKPILLHADRSKFQFVLYSDQIPRTSVTPGTVSDSHIWVDTAHLSNQNVVDRIQDDQIDVLFDMIGHGLSNRMEVFALRPARLQIAWAGYLATTGLEQMDYIMADAMIFPESLTPYFSETPIRLPHTYMAYIPSGHEPPTELPPFHEQAFIAFGSCASPEKISEEVIDAWSKILLNTVGSTLRLMHGAFDDKGVQNDFQSWFQSRGVDLKRLLFGQTTEQTSAFSRYRLLDIALDPFPVNDPCAALESLWMGVPVVCLQSERMAGRTVASILSQLELPFCVAQSIEDYILNAINLANDRAQLNRVQENLRSLLIKSPICDAKAFVKAFQDTIFELWSRPIAK